MKTTWTDKQRHDFRRWHDRRMVELQYPPELVAELTNARERWMPPVDFARELRDAGFTVAMKM